MKYVKSFLLVLLNNALLIMFLFMLIEWKHWGIVPILIIGLFYFVSFSMLVVGMLFIKLPSENDAIEPVSINTEKEIIHMNKE